MNVAPVPSEFESRTNASFEALMWALARPGRVRDLPGASEAVIAEALLDRECRVWCAEPAMADAVVRTGAELVGIAEADHVFAGTLEAAGMLGQVAVGSDLHPEDGATLIVNARIGAGERLRLTGPGVDGALEIALAGLPGGFWAKRAERLRYPMGFDIFFTDGAQVLGLPRSVQAEVL